MSISYSIKPVKPEAHLFEVSLTVTNPAAEGQLFSLPNWIPGSYMIRDFSKNIVEMRAHSNGRAVPLEKLDKSSWQAQPGLDSITLDYRVYAWDLSVRTAHLDKLHGFFNGTSVFLAVGGQESEPVDVALLAPDGEEYKGWALATSMPSTDVDAQGFGQYSAADYDELIDHPVEMGTFKRIDFEACGVPHEIILTGDCHADHDKLAADLKTICEYQIRFFGEPAPVDRYVFMVMVVGNGYGGLEHRASTALLATRDHMPMPGAKERSDRYIEFLGLCSHEYFHTWNVKRMKPARFVPYALEAESYTRLLWFFEGITSYYDDLLLWRAGLITSNQYLDLLSKIISRVQRGAGRRVQSVTDSSFDAWNKFYKQDENAPNAIVSYYAKGALVSLCLDSRIRNATNGAKSLDDLLRLMWSRWLETGEGVAEREPEQLAAEIAGTSLDEFFDAALYSTKELPVQQELESLGVKVHWRARQSASDAGGGKAWQSKAADADNLMQPWLGANIAGSAGNIKVSHVFSEGAAEKAGLAAGDIVVAVNNLVVDADAVADLLKRYSDHAELPVHFIRHGVLHSCTLPLQTAPVDTCSLELPEIVGWPDACAST